MFLEFIDWILLLEHQPNPPTQQNILTYTRHGDPDHGSTAPSPFHLLKTWNYSIIFETKFFWTGSPGPGPRSSARFSPPCLGLLAVIANSEDSGSREGYWFQRPWASLPSSMSLNSIKKKPRTKATSLAYNLLLSQNLQTELPTLPFSKSFPLNPHLEIIHPSFINFTLSCPLIKSTPFQINWAQSQAELSPYEDVSLTTMPEP